MGHIVFKVPDVRVGEQFYTKLLEFRVSDRYAKGAAVFLRCSAEQEHHNLLFLNSRGGPTELDHVAFEVREIHEVFGGGVYMRKLGWPTAVGPGRHPVSSAYFWYFKCPFGGNIEYFADSDYVTDNWKPTIFRVNRFSEWHVPDGVGGLQGGQIISAMRSGAKHD